MPLSSTCPPRPFRATLIHPLTTPKQRDASGDKGFSIAKQDLCGRFVFWGVDPRAQRSFNGSVLPEFPILVISRNPFPMSVGEGFRLLDDYELLLFYRIFGLMSIVIGQVRLGFYGCRVG